MKSAAKKRRADHGAAWSDESEASILFFKQGEANAEADIAAYQRELAEATRSGGLRRWWLLAGVVALAAIAVIAYVASS
jgi:cytochrome c-type biogenesis protein CcmH/NrfG